MRILVTGATGFVGQARVQHLMNAGHDVISIGRTHNVLLAPYEHRTDIAEENSIFALLERLRPDRVEHFASVATVSVSRRDPYETFRTNILGVVNVLESCKKSNIKSIMVFTTDKYYGNLEIASEGDRPIVTSGAYETSKLCQDIIAQSYREAGLPITIIRSCNIFGPNDSNRRIIPNSIRDLQEGKQPLIFTNIRGVRQYIYIRDVFKALDLILEKTKNETFNIGTSTHLSQEEVVELIVNIWNEKHHTNIKPLHKEGEDMKEIPDQYLVWDKLRNELSWEPKYTMRSALEEMIDEI
jgi:nucleoside-diphosphate-sugar epimerase